MLSSKIQEFSTWDYQSPLTGEDWKIRKPRW
jgi:hypothetical protein